MGNKINIINKALNNTLVFNELNNFFSELNNYKLPFFDLLKCLYTREKIKLSEISLLISSLGHAMFQ
jgi:hypothetical protein